MDLKRVSQTENVIPQERAKIERPGSGPSFAETLTGVQTDGLMKQQAPSAAGINLRSQGLGKEPVKFSNHAVDRMVNRGIQFSKEDLGRLSEAVDRASAKGSKDSLILMNDTALIVSVKNKTVVTVMDKNALKENVFTNIDSTIVI